MGCTSSKEEKVCNACIVRAGTEKPKGATRMDESSEGEFLELSLDILDKLRVLEKKKPVYYNLTYFQVSSASSNTTDVWKLDWNKIGFGHSSSSTADNYLAAIEKIFEKFKAIKRSHNKILGSKVKCAEELVPKILTGLKLKGGLDKQEKAVYNRWKAVCPPELVI